MHTTEYMVLITDETLQVVGDPIVTWTQLDITLRRNEPDSGLVVVPVQQWIVDQLAPGRRVVIVRNLGEEEDWQTNILTAGPIEKIAIEKSDDGENAGLGKLTINFSSDLARVVARLAYPDPTQTASTQTTDHWTFSGNAETALRNLVNLNAGPGALAPRRVPMLALGATASVGSSVDVVADRMEPLGDLMREIARVGGDIGFRTVQSGSQILFEVYQPADKSTEVLFGWNLGNLKYLMHEESAPTATTAVVGGQGEGAERALIERSNAADETAWGRFEKLVSRPGDLDAAVLNDDGDKLLAQEASTDRMVSAVADSHQQRYGVHYQVGDIVSVSTDHGHYLSDHVETVHIQVYPTSGEYVAATIGSQAAKTEPYWVQKLREIDERLSTVERTVKPATVP